MTWFTTPRWTKGGDLDRAGAEDGTPAPVAGAGAIYPPMLGAAIGGCSAIATNEPPAARLICCVLWQRLLARSPGLLGPFLVPLHDLSQSARAEARDTWLK